MTIVHGSSPLACTCSPAGALVVVCDMLFDRSLLPSTHPYQVPLMILSEGLKARFKSDRVGNVVFWVGAVWVGRATQPLVQYQKVGTMCPLKFAAGLNAACCMPALLQPPHRPPHHPTSSPPPPFQPL